jgi:hypothetical protein
MLEFISEKFRAFDTNHEPTTAGTHPKSIDAEKAKWKSYS